MRNLLILITFFFPALVTVSAGVPGGAGAPATKISQLADGKLSGNTYSNDALGVRLEIPGDWIAVADPKGPVSLDTHNPDSPVNRCSKILLSSQPAQPGASGFNSTSVLFAVDPRCFSDAKFPTSLKNRRKVQEFATKMVKAFMYAGFISPHGADVDAYPIGGRIMVVLTGDAVMPAGNNPDQAAVRPVHINTKLSLTEANGYWVVSAALVDDEGKEKLQVTKISFRVKD